MVVLNASTLPAVDQSRWGWGCQSRVPGLADWGYKEEWWVSVTGLSVIEWEREWIEGVFGYWSVWNIGELGYWVDKRKQYNSRRYCVQHARRQADWLTPHNTTRDPCSVRADTLADSFRTAGLRVKRHWNKGKRVIQSSRFSKQQG